MSKYTQGIFVPKNPQKLMGSSTPKFRSSWELRVMSFFDSHPSVLQWSSEAIRIPYVNPLTGKGTVYIPDFFVVYQGANGTMKREMIEVKPRKETLMEAAKSRRDKAYVVINTAKWVAALAWCKRHNVTFRVLNEDSIFASKGKGKK